MTNLQKAQDYLNSNPCSYCGKMHRVEFLPVVNGMGRTVRCSFSDDACDPFRQYAIQAGGQANKSDRLPYPLP